MTPIRIRHVASAVIVLATIPSTAAARVIGSESASGDYATAVASGNANTPSRLYARIKTSPRQHATGNYSVVCSRGGAAGSKSGKLAGTGTFRRRLKMPMRNPDSCSVSALGSLDKGGHIKVVLIATG